jgi:hypothetical protein
MAEPKSANTQTVICQQICDLNTLVEIIPPHPVWTDNYGTPVTQLNMVVIGSGGLNS